MSWGFNDLRAVLHNWPAPDASNAATRPDTFGRLRHVLGEAVVLGAPLRRRDFQVLIRQVLVRESVLVGRSVPMSVPVLPGWPTEADWREHHVRVTGITQRVMLVEAELWAPHWLEGGRGDPFRAAAAEVPRRDTRTCPADPCVTEVTGFSNYLSHGQREAIRSYMLAPPGATVVATIPTGSGKSLVGYLPALLGPQDGNFVLFVVPTIALAFDQARQFSALAGNRLSVEPETLAWHSDLGAGRRTSIRSAIRRGTQRVLFTSPESICGPLRLCLFDAARSHYLAHFVVDEVHLLSQWGAEFRPDYQAMAGIRRGLLKQCADGHRFKTLLMTATLTEDTLEAIETFFGPAGDIQVTSAVSLRPEPEYWMAQARDRDDRTTKILEAIDHAPRPLLLYVTVRKDAEAWNSLLRERGFGSTAAFHGNTPNAERRRIIDAWSRGDLDIIVATSAFGVGMDKGDVRAVIHACVPETLDRYYQEVGRGGRDGKACSSLLVYEPTDVQIAERLAMPAIITQELGRGRWKAMLRTAKAVDGDPFVYEVDLGTVPGKLRHQSDYNTAWNTRTLLLLARAGVIALDAVTPPATSRLDDESEADFDKRRQKDYDSMITHAAVRLLRHDHTADAVWTGPVELSRQDTARSCQRQFSLMWDVLQGSVEVSDALATCYELVRSDLIVPVSRNCSGCPTCRESGVLSTAHRHPDGIAVRTMVRPNLAGFTTRIRGTSHGRVLVSYPVPLSSAVARRITDAVSVLVETFGFRELALPEAPMAEGLDALAALHRRCRERFVAFNDIGGRRDLASYFDLGRVSLLLPWGRAPIPDEVLYLERRAHVIIVPEDVEDPIRPDRRYLDVITNALTLSTFERMLYRWES